MIGIHNVKSKMIDDDDDERERGGERVLWYVNSRTSLDMGMPSSSLNFMKILNFFQLSF